MKKSFKTSALISRSIGMFGIITIGAMITLGYGFKNNVDNLWKQLGMKQQDANESIRQSFSSGFLNYAGAKNIKNIAIADKKAVARELLNYTKQFMNTKYKAYYEKEKAAAKPQEPKLEPVRTWEQIQKEEIARLEKSISETEKNMKAMNKEMQQIFAGGLEKQKQSLEECKKPGNRTITAMAQAEKNGQDWKRFAYKQDLKNWEEQYPENFNGLIRKRLQKMLDATVNVDFNAELITVGSRKIFAKPEYERKSREWKMAYRAGKEVTELTRAFAQQWLSELK